MKPVIEKQTNENQAPVQEEIQVEVAEPTPVQAATPKPPRWGALKTNAFFEYKKIAKIEELIANKFALEQATIEPKFEGEKIKLEDLVSNLYKIGYKRESIVNKTGEIAVRGFIIDVFPIVKVLKK